VNAAGIKLTTYFSERDRSGHRLLGDALFDVYERHQIHTSVLLRGAGGFGQHHHIQTDRLLTLSENLPAVSIAIDAKAQIEQALPAVLEVATHGLVTLERAQVLAGDALAGLRQPSTGDGLVKITLYGGRAIRAEGRAGYVAAIEVLREAGVTAATTLLAVDGTLHSERQRARFFARNSNVPLMLLAIGTAESIGQALPSVVDLLEDPVATVERVHVAKSAGMTVSSPPEVPAEDPSGLPIWQKVMISAEEQARIGGHPLYRELVTRLWHAGAAGATALRAVRGFYGDRGPFADRLLSLTRNVPVHVIVIDTPMNMQRWWPIIDDATAQDGIVTSELVPASHAFAAGGEPVLKLARTPTSSDG
jgi:PII-like signaling protein